MGLDLETEFVKVPGANGGNWGVRVRGRTKSPDVITNIYFYAGLEGLGNIHLANSFEPDVPSLC